MDNVVYLVLKIEPDIHGFKSVEAVFEHEETANMFSKYVSFDTKIIKKKIISDIKVDFEKYLEDVKN